MTFDDLRALVQEMDDLTLKHLVAVQNDNLLDSLMLSVRRSEIADRYKAQAHGVELTNFQEQYLMHRLMALASMSEQLRVLMVEQNQRANYSK